MKGCRHKKGSKHLAWCYACGARRAGPKPAPTMKVGWFASVESEDWPGKIGAIHITLMGCAVETQSWCEYVTVVFADGATWEGPADKVTRLVAKRTSLLPSNDGVPK